MNPRALLVVAGVAGVIAYQRKRSSLTSSPAPAPAPAAPPVVTPATSSSKPKPKPSFAGMAQTVMLPIGWRRLAASEVTPELEDVRRQIAAAGFQVGTFNPFQGSDGKSYAALVERNDAGAVVVSMAVDGSN
jgi:hypothetical protein